MRLDLNDRLGFIGCGALGSALIQGILDKRLYPPRRLYVFDRHPAKTKPFEGIQRCSSAFEVVYNTGTTFLLVKPQDVLSAVQGANFTNKVLVSMVAGITCHELRANLTGCNRVLRIMSNLALRYGMAATAYEVPNNLAPIEQERVLNIFRMLGTIEAVSEADMDVATAINGSGPAYFTYIIDAMANAAQAEGMPREAALRLIMQTVRSALTLMHYEPETDYLIKAVSSRGGTTEAALKIFEKKNMVGTIEKAIEAATKRSRAMSENLEVPKDKIDDFWP